MDKLALSQASAAKKVRTALFWVITQRVMVISFTDVSGQPIDQSIF
jgi:hypothetical protein